MAQNPITVLILIIGFYPIIRGLIVKFSAEYLKRDLEGINGDISFVISIFVGIYYSKKIFIRHEGNLSTIIFRIIPSKADLYIQNNPLILYVVIMPILIFIIYKIINFILYLLNKITFYPLLEVIEKNVKKKSQTYKRIIGAIFGIPKGICYLLILVFALNFLSVFNISDNLNDYLSKSKPYNYICKEIVVPITNSGLAKQLPNIINDSFRIQIKNEKQNNNIQAVYYNGITIDEGVKTNQEINEFAKKLVKPTDNTLTKAKKLYEWVGSNIDYDSTKAEMIMENDFRAKSGSIPTFYSRKGICFDYACLYVSMCRANNIKVRLITGEGYNGVNWVGHAWNEVYIPETDKWIEVDPTFYKGGNYFNSRLFKFDHRDAQIADEW